MRITLLSFWKVVVTIGLFLSAVCDGMAAPAELDGLPRGFCGTGLNPLVSQNASGLHALATPPPADTLPEPTVLDIMVIYTPQALLGAASEEDLRAGIATNVVAANESFAASGVNVRLNLVHTGLINYTESGSLQTDSTRLLNAQAPLDRAHSLRNDFKADIVCMLIDQDVIGIGGQASDVPTIAGNQAGAFIVMRRCMLNYSLVFAHEVGHLLGCDHSRQDLTNFNPDDPFYKARFPYIFGSRWEVDGVGYADIMTYPPGIHYHVFGNPDKLMDGVPMGRPESGPQPSNAAKTINRIAPVVALYRTALSRVEFSDAAVRVRESAGSAKVGLKRTGDLNNSTRVTVNFDASSTAKAGLDYTKPSPVTVSFATNQATAEFTIPILPDDLLEGDETIVLTLSTPAGNHGIGLRDSMVVAIQDDQAPFTLSSGEPGVAAVSVNYFGDFPETSADGNSFAEVAWHTEDGTAVAGREFQASAGTLKFSPGNTSTNIYVTMLVVLVDAVDAVKTFSVVVGGLKQEIRLRPGPAFLERGEGFHTGNELNSDGGLNALSLGSDRLLVWGNYKSLEFCQNPMSFVGNRVGVIYLGGRTDGSGCLSDYNFQPPPFLAGHRELPGRMDPPMVHTALPMAGGQVLVGGQFSRVGGQPRRNLACLKGDGALNPQFNANLNFNGPIYALAQDSFYIFVGGLFKKLNGETRPVLVRLWNDGTLDTNFKIQTGITDPSQKERISALGLQRDGKILAGGSFTAVDGVISSNLVRLNPDGSRDATFKIGSGASGQVLAVAVQPDGRILVAGHFDGFNNKPSRKIVRLNSNGTIDTTFKSPNPNAEVRHLLVLPDGRILVSGMFTTIGGKSQRFLALLRSNGSLDDSFDFGTGPNKPLGNDMTIAFGEQGSGQPFTVDRDGGLYVAGSFNQFDGLPSSHLIRFDFTQPQAVFSPLHIVNTNDPVDGLDSHLMTEIHGFPGAKYQLEASTDLRTWQKVRDVQIEGHLSSTSVELPQGMPNVTFRVAERQSQ